MTITLDGTSGITTPTYGGAVTGEYTVPVTSFKNRIINGAMVIDQRNAGASVATTAAAQFTYTLDRWSYYGSQASKYTVQQNAGSVTPPAGFKNYLGVTVTSAYSVAGGDLFMLTQVIEGYNMADLNWGSGSASAVTFSFWVRSSLTGTFGGALLSKNADATYPFTYTISSANTWEKKTISISGPAIGTWYTDNTQGCYVSFSLGTGPTYIGTANTWAATQYWAGTGSQSVVGTNGATFYVTGVQLEKGSTATSFDYRSIGTETELCQRYYYGNTSTSDTMFTFLNGNNVCGTANFPVFMRAAPTVIAYYNSTPNVIAQVGYGNHAVTGIGGTTQKSFRTINGNTFSSSPYGFYEFNFTASAEL